ncbi:MAG TPA: RidA family protein [Brevundimonas sp.]|jgi:enamine deaminase RidA (YjgF/YER057c/UK114 family)|uniref:RidA family protein n=1 Tax=Brevundimonas sp. TaxID=1871086 RepID=UPI002D164415|nr:RidA family protein [Brevundimonas sp.]HRH19186.1 RidA family protein [Brevundimonas sp.]
MSVADRLKELGITLPPPAAAVANYVPFMRTGNLLHIAGQLSNDASGGVKGTVGVDVDIDQAVHGARLSGINLLAQMNAALVGDLGRVTRIVKLGGFVQAGPDFIEIPKVINGCSDLMVDAFGDIGRHARSAVGVYKLPLGFAVEVDAIVEVR